MILRFQSVLALVWAAALPELLAAQSTVRQDSIRFAAGTIVHLRNGANAVDLLGNGSRGSVIVGRRENYNAHGYSLATFYTLARVREGTPTLWHLIPLFAMTPVTDGVSTAEGADCILQDMRLVRLRRGGPVTLIVARRDVGETYASLAPVRFSVYELRRNDDGEAGWPLYRFELQGTIRARRPYCDVNEAFARELGLGRDGLGEAEGGR